MATVFYRPQALETIARRTLSEYDIMYLNGSPRAVPIETIIEKTFGLRIEYQYLTNDARELGRMIYDSGITTYYNREIMDYALMRVEGGTMLIEAALLEDEKSYGRLRFTLAHELAHYIIHKQIFSGTGVAAALYNNDTDEDATEWQAKIGVNGEKIFLGTFQNIEDAIKARLKAEKKYYGEFAPQKDLFKKYEIA